MIYNLIVMSKAPKQANEKPRLTAIKTANTNKALESVDEEDVNHGALLQSDCSKVVAQCRRQHGIEERADLRWRGLECLQHQDCNV